jgi:hypothetical protein
MSSCKIADWLTADFFNLTLYIIMTQFEILQISEHFIPEDDVSVFHVLLIILGMKLTVLS